MRTMIMITGYSGAGKSAVAQLFAKTHHTALLRQDTFLFQMNGIRDPINGVTDADHTLAVLNMHSCAENYLQAGWDIVIEGALVAVTQDDPIDATHFLALAEKHGYRSVVFTFIADLEVRKERMQKRNNIVPDQLEQKLHEAADELRDRLEGDIVIDTTNLDESAVLVRIEDELRTRSILKS